MTDSATGWRMNPDEFKAAVCFVLATDAGRAAIRAGVRAELGDLASHFGKAWQSTVGDGRSLRATDIAWILEHFLASAAPREPAQDEPAAGVAQDPPDSGNDPFAAAGAAGFAEGVEAAAEIADGFLVRGPYIAAAIRSMPLPAAPDPLLPGLRAARAKMAELTCRRDTAYVEDIVELRDWLDAEIARRGGAWARHGSLTIKATRLWSFCGASLGLARTAASARGASGAAHAVAIKPAFSGVGTATPISRPSRHPSRASPANCMCRSSEEKRNERRPRKARPMDARAQLRDWPRRHA